MIPIMNPQEIDVVILCGGQGKRLKKVISDRPKPIVIIKGRPFLDILIDYVASFGFRRFILCIGYMGDAIKKHYQEKEDPLITLFSEEKKPLGTGGAIRNARSLIRSNPFLVMNGDSFCKVDFCEFADFHKRKKALLSIVLVKAEKAKDYGVIRLENSQRIVKFDEKASMKNNSFISAGIYLFDTSVFSLIPPHKNFSVEYDLFPKIVDREFYGYITPRAFIDIGTPERYEKAKQLLKNDKITYAFSRKTNQ